MKFSKNILTLVFAVAMVCVFAVVAYAAPTLTIGTVEANPGEEVDITVDLSNGTGLTTLEYSITLPGDSTLVSITQGTAFSTGAMWSQVGTEARTSRMDMTWGGNTTDGLLDTFRITAPSEAGEYVITGTLIADGDLTYGPAGTVVVPGTITVKGAETPAATLTAIGKNLVLDGGINAKVKFEYTGTETLYINGNAVEKAADGYYYAEIAKSAKDYADEVTFTATASDVDEVVVPTSVAAIIDEYQATQSDAELLALVDAAETYCSYAATYFADGTVPTVDVTVPDYKTGSSITGTQDGITLNSVSLILRDKVALRVYFNVAAGATLPDGLTALEGYETLAYYEKANINVTELAAPVEATVGGIQIDVIPLAYANLDIDANTANLVKALYNYYVAAVAYAG